MTYPVKCKKCNNPIYGPVKYCPFCGAVFVSVTAPSEKQNLDALRSEINSALTQGEYTPDFRQFINKKGKNMGISEESSDILLLEVLKEKKFIPDRVNTHDPLSECWYSAEKKEKNIDKPEQPPETIKYESPKEEKREEVKQPGSTLTGPDTMPPTVTSFSIPSTSSSLTVLITSFEATGIGGTVAAFMVTETPNQPLASDTRWSVSKPTSYPFTSAGTHTLYAWTKDNSNNVSTELKSATVAITPPKPLFLKVVAAIIVLSIGYFVYTNFFGTSHFLGKIDRALNEKRYFSPSGNSVADFYRAKKAESPNSPELREAVSRIRQKLEPEGDAAFQKLYAESDDSDWDNTVNIYKLLNEIMPNDSDIAAKAEFCQAHQIIKGKMKKDYTDILVRYQKALELKPNWVFAINGIAKVYVRKDSPYYNKEEALSWYNKATEADQNFPWAYTNIAAIYMEDKQWDMAEQALLNALRIKNNWPSILTELGKACEKQQKTQDAQNYYQEAMKYEKDSEKIAWLQKKISAIQQP